MGGSDSSSDDGDRGYGPHDSSCRDGHGWWMKVDNMNRSVFPGPKPNADLGRAKVVDDENLTMRFSNKVVEKRSESSRGKGEEADNVQANKRERKEGKSAQGAS